MIIQLQDWVFDIDLEQTEQYSAAEAAEHCDCGYCRNYYQAVDQVYPTLRQMLFRFGLHIEAPDELMPYDLDGKIYYEGVYVVCGTILQKGIQPLSCDDVQIEPYTFDGEGSINHGCPEPCFALNLGMIILPWVLNEPMQEVVSPANEPSFLSKMWQRLLKKQKETPIS